MEKDAYRREVRARDEEILRQKNLAMIFEKKLVLSKHLLTKIINAIMMSENRDIVDDLEEFLNEDYRC